MTAAEHPGRPPRRRIVTARPAGSRAIDSNKDLDSLVTQAEGIVDVNQRHEIMAKLEAILQDDGLIVQPV